MSAPFSRSPTRRRPALRSALIALLVALAPAATAAVPQAAPGRTAPTFLIVNPAGRGNQGMAEGFLSDFAKALKAAWPDASRPEFQGRYHVSSADALASVRREAPAFALVSPGFYLENRRALDLHVLAVPVRAEGESVVRILARDGAVPANPPRLGGQLAGEPGWLLGVVIGQDHPWLRGEPQLVPVAKTLEAVRMAEAGQLDFIALHDSEWQLLQRTGKSAGWRVVATSPILPEGPLVSFGPPEPLDLAALDAIRRFPDSEGGRAVLSRMTLKAFAPASDTLFDDAAKRLAAWTSSRASEGAAR